jgi:hypothetical protein
MTFAEWLALREPADAAARARELVELLPASDRWVIHDLGSGTGAMGRWLAPQLDGPQHWVLHDRDAELLSLADVPATTVETRRSDVTRLGAGDLAGATLVTASALLDVLTGDELGRLVAACAGAGCPALLTLSVTGRVELAPEDPLDRRVAAAFNAHQRRNDLLGPDAGAVAAEAFRRSGADVISRPSRWRLGAAHAGLAAAWFTGWVDAACEQDPELEVGAYRRRRPAHVTVGHVDLLALPPQAVSKRGESA